MDDILASIRKIIDEDDKKSVGPRDAAEPALESDDGVEETDGDEPLELDEAVEDEAPPSIGAPASEDVRGRDVSESGPASAAEDAAGGDGLMSDSARSSAAAALGSLARVSDRGPLDGVPRGRPVEQLVMEQLRPMLSQWLDEHLPGVVERIVEREVRYLSRRLEGDDRT